MHNYGPSVFAVALWQQPNNEEEREGETESMRWERERKEKQRPRKLAGKGGWYIRKCMCGEEDGRGGI